MNGTGDNSPLGWSAFLSLPRRRARRRGGMTREGDARKARGSRSSLGGRGGLRSIGACESCNGGEKGCVGSAA